MRTILFAVDGLDKNKEYEFRVKAKNAAGLGEPSTGSGPVETKPKCCKLIRVAYPGFVQVLEILESPGISGNHFPGLESPGILMQVLESPGNLNYATSF